MLEQREKVRLIDGVGSKDDANIKPAMRMESGAGRVMLDEALWTGNSWILCRGIKGELRTVFQGVSKVPSIALLG